MSKSREQKVEHLYDENGTLLLEQPYPFQRLFAVGQEQIMGGTSMTVISCVLEGNIVVTRVRLSISAKDFMERIHAE